MRKYIAFAIFALCLPILCISAPLRNYQLDPIALEKLAAGLGISSDDDLISAIGRIGLRRPGQERWEMAELEENQRVVVLDFAIQQGIFAECTPSSESYDKALILGASTWTMQQRLNYLIELWNRGFRFDEIVWLTGERPLDHAIEGYIDLCNNESEAARIIWDQSPMPVDMHKLPTVFIEVPMKIEGASIQRPNTLDTIAAWLTVSPNPCKALFISDQPYCGYQFSVIKAHLPDEFSFDLAGPGADPTSLQSAAAIVLDCISRWIWVEDGRFHHSPSKL